MPTGSTLQLAVSGNWPLMLHSWDGGDFHQSATVSRTLKAKKIFLADMGLVFSQSRQMVILKVANGSREFESLRKEHDLYTNQLARLQGLFVPRCYGLFSCIVNGSHLGCLVLEYIEPHTDMEMDPVDWHQKVMFALCEIHKAGVRHGNVQPRHTLQKGYSPCIVDFSTSTVHRCSLIHPSVLGDRHICEELYKTECFFEAKERALKAASGSSALQEGALEATDDGCTPVARRQSL